MLTISSKTQQKHHEHWNDHRSQKLLVSIYVDLRPFTKDRGPGAPRHKPEINNLAPETYSKYSYLISKWDAERPLIQLQQSPNAEKLQIACQLEPTGGTVDCRFTKSFKLKQKNIAGKLPSKHRGSRG